MESLENPVNLGRRTVSPAVFFDPEIYSREQERIFGRCWLFLGHDSQLREPNSFLQTYMGEEPIIVWRGSDGVIRAFLNSCTHRGMKLCREDRGKARSFTCPYHGWTFDSNGRLIGVPHRKKYDSLFDPAEWGLIEVPKVSSYAGLIFGNLDTEALSLEDYLGDIRWYIDTQFRRTAGGRVIFAGVQKHLLDVNWKIAVEQFAGDGTHVLTTHRSAAPLGLLGDSSQFHKAAPLVHDFFVGTPQAHSWASLSVGLAPNVSIAKYVDYEDEVERNGPSVLTEKQRGLTRTGAVGFLFPNFAVVSFLGGFGIRMFMPKGPGKIEVWIWSGADADAPEWRQELSRDLNIRSFTAGGMIDIDDVEMWTGCQKGLSGFYRRKYPTNYQLGASATKYHEEDRPGEIEELPSESGCIGFHRRWSELMGYAPDPLAGTSR